MEPVFVKHRLCVCIVSAALLPPSGLKAEPATHRADYRVSFLGLPVAQASFLTMFEGSSFRVAGEMRSAGVGNIVGRTSGATSVSGEIADDHLQARHYLVTYESDGEEHLMEVRFQDGDVVASKLVPEKARSRGDWVPTDEGDLDSVLDPVSGLMVPAGAPVCDRTVPLFDGETRIDVHLTEVGSRPFTAEGYSGTAIVCRARAEPKSGYHARKKSTEFIRRMSVEIWFAPNEAAGIYAPVYARIPTSYGPVTVTAVRFGS